VAIVKEVIKLQKELKRYDNQIYKMRKKKCEKTKELIKAFIPFWIEANKKWVPVIGEDMMLIDLFKNGAFKVTLHSILEGRGSAKENEGNYHGFPMEPNVEEHKSPVFVIPMFFYEEIKDKIKLDRWDVSE
jgi:hypothetical protein